MSELQQTILKKYFELHGKQPIRKLAKDTGIQSTRVFRIMNGSEMKIGEYEKFKSLLNEKNENQIDSYFHEYEGLFTQKMRDEIQLFVERLVSKRKLNLCMVQY